MSWKNYTALHLNGEHLDHFALATRAAARHQLSPPDWESSLWRWVEEWLAPAPTVAVQTSGSTGLPKTITLFKDAMLASAHQTARALQLAPFQTALLCLPCDYIAGKMMVVRAFAMTLRLFTTPPAANPLAALPAEAFPLDFAAMIPLQVATALRESPDRLCQVRQLIIGGGAVSPALRQALQTLPTACFATYGMTETITHIALQRLNGASAADWFELLPDVRITQDERGCLVVVAPAWVAPPVVTNDLVAMRSERQFIWQGRWDNVINTGGVKVCPEIIEQKLAQWFAPQRFIIGGLPDARLGERVVLVVEGSPWTKAQHAAFQDHAATILKKYELPKAIYFLPTFLETANGKIQRASTFALL